MTIGSRALSLVLLSISLISLIVTRASAQLSPSAVAAGGDTCASPTLISSLPFNDSGNTTGAADDIRLTGCSGFPPMAGPDLIYTFTVFSGSDLTFTLTPSGPNPTYDPAIYIRSACAQTSGTCVASSDANGSGGSETIHVTNLAAGTYYFYVDSYYVTVDTGVCEVPGFCEGPYTLTVTGSFGVPNNTKFYTLTPCRIVDTRGPVGPVGGPALAGGQTRVFPITGQCNVPSTAKSVSGNVTVVQPTAPGYLTLFPGGTPPVASTINFRTGQIRANNAIMPLSATGTLSVTDGQGSGTTHFLLDVNGYFQ
jgi:hypothetical protein